MGFITIGTVALACMLYLRCTAQTSASLFSHRQYFITLYLLAALSVPHPVVQHHNLAFPTRS